MNLCLDVFYANKEVDDQSIDELYTFNEVEGTGIIRSIKPNFVTEGVILV